jgi:hypothetical protein
MLILFYLVFPKEKRISTIFSQRRIGRLLWKEDATQFSKTRKIQLNYTILFMFFMCIWGGGGGVFVLVWDAYWHLVRRNGQFGNKTYRQIHMPNF